MKIAHIDLNLALESGDPRMAYRIARGLKNRGHDITIYTLSFDPTCFPNLHEGLKIREIKTSLGESIEAQHKLAAAIDPDVDLVLCEDAFRVGVFYRRHINPSAKVVWIMNSPPFEFLPKQTPLHTFGAWAKAQLSKRDTKKYMDGIDHIVVIDAKGIEYSGALKKPATIIPIGVDFQYFYAPVKSRDISKSVQLLGVGNLSRYRRYEDIVRAVAILQKQGHDARALLICKDYYRNASYHRQFEELIKKEGVEKYIDRRYDGANDGELLRAYHESDVYVFPNHVRIWGMAAFEAMAAGLTLIVSRITTVAELLEDGKNAFFVDRLRPDQIANQVVRLMGDRELYRNMGEAGQRFVKENLSWEQYIDKLEGVIRKTIKP